MKIREIVKCTCEDVAKAMQIYKKAGRDFSFATPAQLLNIMKDGEIYLCKNGDNFTAVCGVVLAKSKNYLCRAICKSGLVKSKNAIILLPIAGKIECDIDFLLDFCLNLVRDNYYIALCPVKYARDYLNIYFPRNLCVVHAYPLYELRPYYFLEKNAFAFNPESSIILPYTNTKAISKMLENEYIAVQFNKITGEIKMLKESVE